MAHIVPLLRGGQRSGCHQRLVSVSPLWTPSGTGASVHKSSPLPPLPACQSQLLPQGPPVHLQTSFQPFLPLTISLLFGQHGSLRDNLALPWQSCPTLASSPLHCLGKDNRKHRRSMRCSLPSPSQMHTTLFPQYAGFAEEAPRGRTPCPPSLALPPPTKQCLLGEVLRGFQ